MSYAELHNATQSIRPPLMIWTRLYRWGGLVLFGAFCFGLGNAASTAHYQIGWLEWRSAKLQQVETHDIPALKAKIPKGAHDKSEAPTPKGN